MHAAFHAYSLVYFDLNEELEFLRWTEGRPFACYCQQAEQILHASAKGIYCAVTLLTTLKIIPEFEIVRWRPIGSRFALCIF